MDSNAIKRAGFFRLANRFPEGAATMTAVREIFGSRRDILSTFANLMAEAGPVLDVDELVASYGIEVDADVAAAPEMPGASELVAKLRRRGLRLYLSSATPRENLFAILRARGWMHWFDGVYGVPPSKIEILHKICEVESINGKEAAVVGDGIDDACAAESIGAHFIAVGCGTYAATNPHARILPLPDVDAQLQKWQPQGSSA